MKFTTEEKLVLGAVLLAAVGALLGFRKPVVSAGTPAYEDIDDDAKAAELTTALMAVANEYGRNFAADVERLMRLETRNFDSMQFRVGNTAGMESFGVDFPYGWGSLREYASNANLSPDLFSTYAMTENNTGLTKYYIKFPNVSTFVDFLSWLIDTKRGGDFGKWYSLDLSSARAYRNKLAGIAPKIVDSFA